MTDSPPRYAPDQPFPPYAFLPGTNRHPTQHPEGHSYTGVREEPADFIPADRWRTNAHYLFGVDLYNHGYLWEAHEAWEAIWHPAKREPLLANFLQGLIQCTAASLKVRMEQPRGLLALGKLGTEKLDGVCAEAGYSYMGLDLRPFIAHFRAFAASEPDSAEDRPLIELED